MLLTVLRIASMVAAAAYLLPSALPTSASLTPEIVHEFPLGTWVEKLAIRSSSPPTILANLLTSPSIYVVDPESKFEAAEVAYFPGYSGVRGIAELGHDVFYVITGNFSLQTFESTPGSYAVWEVDLRHLPAHVGKERARTREVAKVPTAGFLNGMTVLNPVEGMLLMADSLYGLIWSLNVHTGEIAVAINDTTMKPVVGGQEPLIGVNGVHVLSGELYYTNSNLHTFNKIALDMRTGGATGPAFTLANSLSLTPDDFAVDFEGNVWIASDFLNQLDFLKGAAVTGALNATVEIVSGSADSTTVAGWTSAAFGISGLDVSRGSLYIGTTGGVPQYLGRNWTTGGTISRIDVGSLE